MGLAVLPLVIGVAVAPAQLKIESGAPAAVVTVTASSTAHLRLWCSAGSLSRPTRLADGRLGASYVAPAAGKPTYAVIAAYDEESGEAGATTVTLVARTEIPVETEPGALVVAVVHGRRSSARANGAGHARVPAWVWPGDGAATVTATDAAGNATTNEVALELPPPDGVFVLAPAEAVRGQGVRVYGFATGGATPQLTAVGARLSALSLAPGVAAATLQLVRDAATLSASVGGDRAEQRIVAAARPAPPARSIALSPAASTGRAAASTPPARTTPPARAATTANTTPPASKTSANTPPLGNTPSANSPSATTSANTSAATPSANAPPSLAQVTALPPPSPWELGAALSGRYSGAFVAGALVVEARRTLRRFAIGLDLDGHYASGSIDGDAARSGGLALRAVGEARFTLAPRAALVVALGAGGHWARLHRAPAAGSVVDRNDGGPSLAAVAGLDARVGPGFAVIEVGYAWTPLAGTSLVNLDGAILSVGYRVARWRRRAWRRRRRGDGTRSRGRRRRARDR